MVRKTKLAAWKFEYQGRGRRAVVGKVIGPENQDYSLSDLCCVDDWIAFIVKFDEGLDMTNQRARVLTLMRHHLVDESKPANELLATTVLRYVPLDQLGSKVKVFDKPNEAKLPDEYYLNQAIDSLGRYSELFSWKQASRTIDETAEFIADLLRHKYETPKKQRIKKMAIDTERIDEEDEEVEAGEAVNMLPVTLFPTAKISPTDEAEEENAASQVDSPAGDEYEDESDADFTMPEEKPKEIEKLMDIEKPILPLPQEPKPASRSPSKSSSPRKKHSIDDDPESVPQTPRKSRKTKATGDSAVPRTPKTPRTVKESKVTTPRHLPTTPHRHAPATPHNRARKQLHLSAVPQMLPCRDNEYAQIFSSLETAINAETGSCIYVHGTPGTGKTAVVREAIAQLDLRRETKDVKDFTFLEINGMKLIHPTIAYDMLWGEIGRVLGQKQKSVSSANAATLLESEFKKPTKRAPVVVLLDELDQLVTKNQSVMYNFFNWPTLPHSKLIVIAVSNTLNLPETLLANKVVSRIGLTRIAFKGYTDLELRQIISSRLSDVAIVEADAIEYTARKVGAVSGDARRALDICRRAIELGNNERVGLEHVRKAFVESQQSPLVSFFENLSICTKVFLCAVMARIRRDNSNEVPVADVLFQAKQLITLAQCTDQTETYLFGQTKEQVRMLGFQHAIQELLEAGVITHQSIKGEATGNIRLLIMNSMVTEALAKDTTLKGIV